MRYVILGLAWTAFCALHSALVSTPCKAWAERALGRGYRCYRLLYNLVALVTLAGVLAYAATLRGQPVFVWHGALRLVQAALLVLAALGFLLGAREYDLGTFLGWTPFRNGTGQGTLSRTGGLSTRGILGLVRHPWYSATFLLLWAHDLDGAALVGNAVLSVYLVVGTWLEERRLVQEFGDAYRDYRERVPMFIPWKGFRPGRGDGEGDR